MQAYLIRKNADQDNPRELVGIYVASSMAQLRDLVDECINIDCADVRELSEGGIYWPSAIPYRVPNTTDPDGPEYPEIPEGASVCEFWFDAFHREESEEWTPLAELVGE